MNAACTKSCFPTYIVTNVTPTNNHCRGYALVSMRIRIQNFFGVNADPDMDQDSDQNSVPDPNPEPGI
jgi:hypothetical protein